MYLRLVQSLLSIPTRGHEPTWHRRPIRPKMHSHDRSPLQPTGLSHTGNRARLASHRHAPVFVKVR